MTSEREIGVDMGAPGGDKSVITYRGRPIDTLTREELLEALRCLHSMHLDAQASRQIEREMEAMFRKARR